MFLTLVVLVDVPEVFPVVVFDDVDNGARVVRGDVELVAHRLGAIVLLLLMLLLVMAGDDGVVECRVGQNERHLERRTERANRTDRRRRVRREKRKHSSRHHLAD